MSTENHAVLADITTQHFRFIHQQVAYELYFTITFCTVWALVPVVAVNASAGPLGFVYN